MRSKIIKKILAYLLITLGIIFLLLMIIIASSQTVWFKDKLKTLALNKINKSLNAVVQVDAIRGNLFKEIALDGIRISTNTDTLLYTAQLQISYKLFDLTKNRLQIENIHFDSLYINLEKENNKLNWQNIAKTNTTLTPESGNNSLPFQVSAPNIEIARGYFQFINLLPQDCLTIKNFELLAGIAVSKKNINATISSLTFNIPAFKTSLDQFSCNVAMMDSLIHVNDLHAKTDSSIVNADLLYDLENNQLLKLSMPNLTLSLNKASQWFPVLSPNGNLLANIYVDSQDNEMQIRSDITRNSQSITLSGKLSPYTSPLSYTLETQLKQINLTSWTDSLNLPKTNINGNIQVQGKDISINNSELLLLAQFNNSGFNTYQIKNLLIKGSKKQKNIDVNVQGTSNIADLNVSNETTLGDTIRYTLKGLVENLQLDRFLPEISSDISLSLTNAGTWSQNGFTNQFAIQSDSITIRDIPFHSISLNGEQIDQSVQIDSLTAISPLGQFNMAGALDRSQNMIFNYSLYPQDLYALTGLHSSSQGQITGIITGQPDSLNIENQINLQNIKLDSNSVAALSGNADVNIKNANLFVNGYLNAGKSQLSGIAIDSTNVQFLFKDKSLAHDLYIQLNDSTTLNLLGTMEFNDSLTASIDSLAILQANQIWQLTGQASTSYSSSAFNISDFELSSNNQSIAIDGSMGKSGNHLLSLNISGLDLDKILNPYLPQKQYKGFLYSKLDLTGNSTKPVLDGSISIESPVFNNTPLERLNGTIQYKEGLLSINSSLINNSEQLLSVSGAIHTDPVNDNKATQLANKDLKVEIATDKMNMNMINALVSPAANIQGDMSFNLKYQQVAGNTFLDGYLKLLQTQIDIPEYAIKIPNLNSDIQIDSNYVQIHSFQSKKDNGIFRLNGDFNLAPDFKPQDLNIHITPLNYPLAKSSKLGLTFSGQLLLQGSYAEPELNGNINILQSRIYLPLLQKNNKNGNTSPALLETVSQKDTLTVKSNTTLESNLKSTVSIRFDKNFWISNNDLNIELGGNLDLVSNGKQMTLFGTIKTLRGTINLYSKRFQIENGEINFTGKKKINPEIDISALHTFRDIYSEKRKLYVNITGNAESPQIAFLMDDESIEEADAISYLLFGRSTNELSYGEKKQLQENDGLLSTASLENWVARRLTAPISRSLQEKLNLDVIEFQGSDNWRQNSIVLGKYITNDLYLSYIQGFNLGQTHELVSEQVSLEYEMNRHFFIQATKGDDKTTGIDFIWKYEK